MPLVGLISATPGTTASTEQGRNMGLTYSKSIKFGALRFNFSSSGIGVSAGIPGFRIGTGPRGAYVSAGAGGFRYRQSLNGARAQPWAESQVLAPGRGQPSAPSIPQGNSNIVHTLEHDSTDVLALNDSSSDSLLESMNEQAKTFALWPVVAGGLLAAAVFLWPTLSTLPSWALWTALLLAVGATAWVREIDRLKKLTVLFYEPDQTVTGYFEPVVDAASSASGIRKLRSILARSTYRDSKYEAGASQGLKLEPGSLSVGQAPGIAANIDVPILKSGKTTLAFFPDRVLAFKGKAVGAVDYSELDAQALGSRFVEREGVPSDTVVVDRTWQYVNKSGGPDKRFKNNREYPVCHYQELRLASSRGLDVRLMGSKPSGFDAFVNAVNNLKRPSTQAPQHRRTR